MSGCDSAILSGQQGERDFGNGTTSQRLGGARPQLQTCARDVGIGHDFHDCIDTDGSVWFGWRVRSL